MIFNKELFEKLNKEKDAANNRAFLAECAINALQELCDHNWLDDPTHGFTNDPRRCEICGAWEDEVGDNEN